MKISRKLKSLFYEASVCTKMTFSFSVSFFLNDLFVLIELKTWTDLFNKVLQPTLSMLKITTNAA